jgi:hypothetical protein
MYRALPLPAVSVLIYRSVAVGVERTVMTGPVVFTAFGLLVWP